MTTDILDMTRRRRTTVRLLAVLGLASFSFMLLFVVSDATERIGHVHQLEPTGSPEAQLGADHPGETVHITGAAAALAIGGTGLVGLIVRPQRAGSATQAGAAAIAMLITIAIVGDPDNHGGQGLWIDPAFLVLALPPLAAAASARPWHAWRQGGMRQPRLLVLAALALPGLWYGIDQGLMQRNSWPPLADPHHQAHWYAMSVLAFLTILVVAAASLHGHGWRIAAGSAGVAAAAIAIASLLDPASASALPMMWAAAAVIWGAAVLATTWREARHADRRGQTPNKASGAPRSPDTETP
jgi:hypothetical protein